jgi:hypothetical protein
MELTESYWFKYWIKMKGYCQMWWYMPVIPATQEAEVGRAWLEVGLGKIVRPYMKNKLKANVLRVKW